jgi:hypothetical protein
MNALIDPSIRSIQGAWAVLRFDDRGYAQIDGSDAGFRRSWAALLLALPFIMLMALAATRAITLSNLAGNAPKLPEIPVPAAFVSGILQWLLSAGCLALIALVFGKADRIKRLIACDNWITLWLMVLEAPFNVLTATGFLHPVGSLVAALLGVFGLVIAARMLLVVLQLPVAAVIGVLIFVLFIQLAMVQLFQGMAT